MNLVPAILSNNIKEVKNKIKIIKKPITKVHIDIMDGLFVPNKTISLNLLKNVKTNLNIQLHLMVYKPEMYVKNLKNVYECIFHIESTVNPLNVIKTLKRKKIRIGIALNPETPISSVTKYLKKIDFVLIMTIHPGFSGQPFIPQTLNKIKDFPSKTHIAVDGGINKKTALEAINAGAKELISATAIFKGNAQKNIKDLWKIIKTHKKKPMKKAKKNIK